MDTTETTTSAEKTAEITVENILEIEKKPSHEGTETSERTPEILNAFTNMQKDNAECSEATPKPIEDYKVQDLLEAQLIPDEKPNEEKHLSVSTDANETPPLKHVESVENTSPTKIPADTLPKSLLVYNELDNKEQFSINQDEGKAAPVIINSDSEESSSSVMVLTENGRKERTLHPKDVVPPISNVIFSDEKDSDIEDLITGEGEVSGESDTTFPKNDKEEKVLDVTIDQEVNNTMEIDQESPMEKMEVDDDDEEKNKNTNTDAPQIDLKAPLPCTNAVNISDLVQNLESPKIDDILQCTEDEDNNLVIDEPEKIQQTIEIPCIKGNCMNHDCATTIDLFIAPTFICNFYGHNLKSNKKYYICNACYESAIGAYEQYCSALKSGEALLQMELPIREEIVELSDESDDENDVIDQDTKFSPETIELIENELEAIINEQLASIKVDQQANWCKQLLEQKVNNNNKMCEEVMADLRSIEQRAYNMSRKLHSMSEPMRVNLPALDITSSTNGRFYKERYELPTFNCQMPRPAMDIGGIFYGVKVRLLGAWTQCKVVDTVEMGDRPCQFKVAFLENNLKPPSARTVPGKYLAYSHPSPVRLRVGDRVIALFNGQENGTHVCMFFPGIIAEPLQVYNNFRYLVFFDDGYAQYVAHQDVRLVYEASEEVWNDVHPHAKDFIQEYLLNYRKERPLVQVKRGHRMITEYKGSWHQAKVIEADASLVKVYFETLKRYEWIYRGSMRLGPLYREKQANRSQSLPAPKRNEPCVEYITLDDEDEQSRTVKNTSTTGPNNTPQSTQPRSVARKSSAGPSIRQSTLAAAPQQTAQKVQNLNNSTIILDDDVGKGRVVYYTARKNYKSSVLKTHQCGSQCLFKQNNNLTHYSPISKPLLCGWERLIVKTNKTKKLIMYKAPCGRRLRNIIELHQYLRKTDCPLGVECFDFDLNLHTLSEYIVEKAVYMNPDISEGQEEIPIPVVNYFDDTKPPPMKYSAVRISTDGVNLNLDEGFLCGCDCEDDCLDKLKCACQMLTIKGAKYGNPNLPPEQVGYQYKRLLDQVRMGIYECNARCKCSKTCLNRVVQQPLSNKLVVFKTNNRGWGLRAVSDIPRGTFICVYAGFLLTEQKANEYGEGHGDEYFADLDYIEIAEETKQGYESDAAEMSDESAGYDPEDDRSYDWSFVVNSGEKVKRVTRQNARSSNDQKNDKKAKKPKRPTSTTPSDEGGEGDRERITLFPEQMGNADDMPNVDDSDKSLRKLYGKEESVYVMDAKISGNIGRYFNHSCEPNMFVQNVFVDTHDLRFPWIAFFASCYIRAGTELTWNYNYDVGSVPGKVLYCQCGAPSCRQRLL